MSAWDSFYRSFKDCGGCNGKGSVPGAHGYPGRCAACNGRGYRADKEPGLLTKRWDRLLKVHPELSVLTEFEKAPDIVKDIVDRYLHTGRAMSDKQVSLVLRIKEQDTERRARWAKEAEEAAPCPEGRCLIEGTVVSAKWRTGDYGTSLKLVVKHESGYKVWGSMPRSLEVAAHEETRAESPRLRYLDASTLPEYLVGRKVSFTATLTPSQKDKSFGFFKRPGRDGTLVPEESSK
tara:strand:+ start:345 stop:1049 length:705 start_codon:yes stop_codon:yes gene_type:complete